MTVLSRQFVNDNVYISYGPTVINDNKIVRFLARTDRGSWVCVGNTSYLDRGWILSRCT